MIPQAVYWRVIVDAQIRLHALKDGPMYSVKITSFWKHSYYTLLHLSAFLNCALAYFVGNLLESE